MSDFHIIVLGESSQDEEEDAKPVTVRFARRETEEAKARRMASYGYVNKRLEEEPWVHVTPHKISVSNIF